MKEHGAVPTGGVRGGGGRCKGVRKLPAGDREGWQNGCAADTVQMKWMHLDAHKSLLHAFYSIAAVANALSHASSHSTCS